MNRYLAITIVASAFLATVSTFQVSNQVFAQVSAQVSAQSTSKNTPIAATPTSIATKAVLPTPLPQSQLVETNSITNPLRSSDLETATIELNTATIIAEITEITETQTVTTPVIAPVIAPVIHVVTYGDSLLEIAASYGVTINDLINANEIANPDFIQIGQQLVIPGQTVTLDAVSSAANQDASTFAENALPERASITERMTEASRTVSENSPFYKKLWLTYYGRPNVPVMGILGEYEIAELATLLSEKSTVFDEANGVDLGIVPAFHLVYGMATRAPGADGSHLAFMPDAQVTEYISAAIESKFQVILDIQIGALTPTAALEFGLPWLRYENVHLALDPEFAMSYQYQTVPGAPPGFVTAEQINDAQATMQRFMQKNKIKGKRVLLLHQFLDTMITNKSDLANDFGGIELVISVDGWGPPAGKVSKYNQFVDEMVHFSSFKLFYRWDEPLMTEREALGVDSINGYDFIEVTPNMIIYQ